MHRSACLALLALVLGLGLAATAGARPTAGCQGSFTKGGSRFIVTSTTVGCARAVPMMKALVTAPTTGSIQRGPLRLLKLRGPSGWACSTSSPIRDRGAGCRKGGDTVIYIRID